MDIYLDAAQSMAALLQSELHLAPGSQREAESSGDDDAGTPSNPNVDGLEKRARDEALSMADELRQQIYRAEEELYWNPSKAGKKLEPLIRKLVDYWALIVQDGFVTARKVLKSSGSKYRDKKLAAALQEAIVRSRDLARHNREKRHKLFVMIRMTNAKRLNFSDAIAPQLSSALESRAIGRATSKAEAQSSTGDDVDVDATASSPVAREDRAITVSSDDSNDSDDSDDSEAEDDADDKQTTAALSFDILAKTRDEFGVRELTHLLQKPSVKRYGYKVSLRSAEEGGDVGAQADASAAVASCSVWLATLQLDGIEPQSEATIELPKAAHTKLTQYFKYMANAKHGGSRAEMQPERLRHLWPIFVVLTDAVQVSEVTTNLFVTQADGCVEDEEDLVRHFVVYLCTGIDLAQQLQKQFTESHETGKRVDKDNILIVGAAQQLGTKVDVLLEVARSLCMRNKLDYWWLLPHNLKRMSEFNQLAVTVQRCTVPAALRHSELVLENLEKECIQQVRDRVRGAKYFASNKAITESSSSKWNRTSSVVNYISSLLEEETLETLSGRGMLNFGQRAIAVLSKSADPKSFSIHIEELVAKLLAPMAIWLRASTLYTQQERFALMTLLSQPKGTHVLLRERPKVNYLAPMLFNVHACAAASIRTGKARAELTDTQDVLCQAVCRYLHNSLYTPETGKDPRMRRLHVVNLRMHYLLDIQKNAEILNGRQGQQMFHNATPGRGKRTHRRRPPDGAPPAAAGQSNDDDSKARQSLLKMLEDLPIKPGSECQLLKEKISRSNFQDPSALEALAEHALEGSGGLAEAKVDVGLELLELAGDLLLPSACYRLGTMYFTGTHVDADEEIARTYYRRIGSGDPSPCVLIYYGTMLLQEDGDRARVVREGRSFLRKVVRSTSRGSENYCDIGLTAKALLGFDQAVEGKDKSCEEGIATLLFAIREESHLAVLLTLLAEHYLSRNFEPEIAPEDRLCAALDATRTFLSEEKKLPQPRLSPSSLAFYLAWLVDVAVERNHKVEVIHLLQSAEAMGFPWAAELLEKI
jgi:hypothetical protein